METLKIWLAKLWDFLKSVWRASLKLFRRELKDKYDNFKGMSSADKGKALLSEVGCFFVAGAKRVTETLLQDRAPRIASTVNSVCLPYDDCFSGGSHGISLLNFISTCSRQMFSACFNGYRPSLMERSYMSLTRLTSIFS